MFLLALTPSVVPVGGSVAPASAAVAGSGRCAQTVSDSSLVAVVDSISNECVVTFSGSNNGVDVTRTWTPPAGVSKVRVLVVGGGGAGGGDEGGGGGAGLYLERTNFSIGASSITVRVGAGGTGSPGVGENGGNSQFGDLVASGGGGGGEADQSTSSDRPGRNGGSGGGGAGERISSTNYVGAGGLARNASNSTPDGVSEFGNNGAAGTADAVSRGGGGGGAGGAGVVGGSGGTGGAGKTSNISGTSRTYAAGGGGGRGNSSNPGAAGSTTGGAGGSSFVGGAGGDANNAGADGLDGRGGGGGGAGEANSFIGGDGGDGIVIVRYSQVPDNPSVSGLQSGDGSLSLTLTAPSHTGAPVADYEYRLNGGPWVSLGSSTAGAKTISADIVNGTLYSVDVRLKNSLGLYSSAVTAGTVVPSPVGEILRFDATHPDSFAVGDASWTDLRGGLSAALVGDARFDARAKAFVLDGTGDYVTPGSFGIDFSRGLAIHTVVDFGETVDWERVFEFTSGNGQAGNVAFGRFSTTSQLYFEVSSNTGTAYTCASAAGAITAGFHAYSVIVASDGTCTFRKNGANLSATDSSAQLPAVTVRDANYIGAARGAVNPLKGSIQSVVVYNTAQVTPTCSPIESTFTGDGTTGALGVTYEVLQFTTAGECDWTAPAGLVEADYLLVAGGGGGGGHIAGGGGAGEMVLGTKSDVSPGSSYRMTIGLGGVGGNRSYDNIAYNGAPGADTSAFSLSGSGVITVNGGGGGATLGGTAGGAGGSGGGGSYYNLPGGASSLLASGFGHAGGGGSTLGCAGAVAGGGGGAGGAGEAAETDGSQHAGDGGAGRASTLTGASVVYAGGGGGGINTGATCVSAGNPGEGGQGGGGAGGPKTVSTANADSRGIDGVANLGAGGGGASGNGQISTTTQSGGNGGTGIVVVRYELPGPADVTGLELIAQRFVDVDGDTDSVALQWAQASAQNPVVTGYRVRYSTSPTMSSYSEVSVSGIAATTATVTGLTDGASYYFQVYAVNANGGLSASSSVTASRAISAEDYALTFNGTSVRASGSAVIPSSGNFTVEAWISPDSDPTDYQAILFQGTSTTDRFGLYYYNDTGFHVTRDGANDNVVVGNLVGQWSHVAVSVDRSTATNNVSLYLNGALAGTVSLAGGDGAGDPFTSAWTAVRGWPIRLAVRSTR